VILAVSALLPAHPNWFGSEWLAALDKVDLAALHETVKPNRNAVQPRSAIAAVLFEQMRGKLPVHRRLLYSRTGKPRGYASKKPDARLGAASENGKAPIIERSATPKLQ
jgi:hypothetical protein